MNVARGRLELATDDADTDQLDKVEDAIVRMASILSDTLTLARDGQTVEDVEPGGVETVARVLGRREQRSRSAALPRQPLYTIMTYVNVCL